MLPAIDGGARTSWLRKATDLAISRLSVPEGFFMMVEGGRIDYFCHYNDAASFVAELLDFNEAVQVFSVFYAMHPQETLILVTADHETGDVSFTEGTAPRFYAKPSPATSATIHLLPNASRQTHRLLKRCRALPMRSG